MKKLLLPLLTLGALVTLAGMAEAQGTGRTFTYTGSSPLNQQYTTNPATFNMTSKVVVNAFLWVSGNLTGSFTVDGWGTGTSAVQPETITIYHTQHLNCTFSGFGDPSRAGTAPDVNTITLQTKLETQFYVGGNPNNFFLSIAMGPASNLNGFNPIYLPTTTGGKFDLRLSRQITVAAGNVAGTYSNVGTLSINSL